MAGELKSVLRQIPWSLLLRAGIAGTGWFFLSFPVFVLISLVFYLKPAFNFSKFLHIFLAFLLLAALIPRTAENAILFSLAFYLLLGIKDLVFIERTDAYEMILILISYFGLLELFGAQSRDPIFVFASAAALYSIAVFAFAEAFLNYERKFDALTTVFPALIFSFLFLELLVVALLTPFNRTFDTILMLSYTVLGIEFLRRYEESKIFRNIILVQGGLAVLILFSLAAWTTWGF